MRTCRHENLDFVIIKTIILQVYCVYLFQTTVNKDLRIAA